MCWERKVARCKEEGALRLPNAVLSRVEVELQGTVSDVWALAAPVRASATGLGPGPYALDPWSGRLRLQLVPGAIAVGAGRLGRVHCAVRATAEDERR